MSQGRWWIGLAAGVGLGVAAFAAWVGLRGPVVVAPARPDRPNVLVIVWDTTRADRMSLYGNPRPTTPRMDAYAASSVVFERASSAGIWTLPSHASLFTGLPPDTHGADERWLWLDGRHVTMAEHFGANGYDTFSMAANTLLCSETNLTQGFRVELNTFKGKAAKAAKSATRKKLIPGDVSNELAPDWKPPEHGAHNAEWGKAVFKEGAPLVGKSLLQWIDQRPSRDQPFFAFLNLMEAHTPRIPSMEARKVVLADDPELIDLGLKTDAAHIRLHFYNFGKQEYSQRELEAIRGVYDATLWDLDQATADLLDGLATRGLLDDTIVVFTSDHGENLGEHHLFNHRFSLWESLIHVPLMIWYPKLEPRREPRPVTTMDVFATVANLAGLEPPPGISSRDLLGPAPSPAVTTLALPLRREIETVKNVHPDVEIEPWMRTGHSLAEDRLKLIRMSDGTNDLYDLAADPGELTPLTDPERHAQLARHLDEWLSSVAPYDPALRGPGDDPTHVRAGQEDLRAQLEALGYTSSEGEAGE